MSSGLKHGVYLSSVAFCAMPSVVKVLEAQLREAKAEARLVAAKLRAQKRSEKGRKQREDARSLRLKQVGFRILALAKDEQKALDKWLAFKLPALQPDERHRLMTDIVDEFISLDIDTIVHALEPIAHGDNGLLQEAKAAIARCDLHLWVCEQNIQKGLAPTVGALLRQRSRLIEKVGEFISDAPIAASKGRWASYTWISRWRKNWKLPKGKIHDRDTPTPSEMREKVRVAQFCSKHKTIQLLATVGFCEAHANKGFLELIRTQISTRNLAHHGFSFIFKKGSEIRTRFRGRPNQSNTELKSKNDTLFETRWSRKP